eukprot:gene2778-4341_t
MQFELSPSQKKKASVTAQREREARRAKRRGDEAQGVLRRWWHAIAARAAALRQLEAEFEAELHTVFPEDGGATMLRLKPQRVQLPDAAAVLRLVQLHLRASRLPASRFFTTASRKNLQTVVSIVAASLASTTRRTSYPAVLAGQPEKTALWISVTGVLLRHVTELLHQEKLAEAAAWAAGNGGKGGGARVVQLGLVKLLLDLTSVRGWAFVKQREPPAGGDAAGEDERRDYLKVVTTHVLPALFERLAARTLIYEVTLAAVTESWGSRHEDGGRAKPPLDEIYVAGVLTVASRAAAGGSSLAAVKFCDAVLYCVPAVSEVLPGGVKRTIIDHRAAWEGVLSQTDLLASRGRLPADAMAKPPLAPLSSTGACMRAPAPPARPPPFSLQKTPLLSAVHQLYPSTARFDPFPRAPPPVAAAKSARHHHAAAAAPPQPPGGGAPPSNAKGGCALSQAQAVQPGAWPEGVFTGNLVELGRFVVQAHAALAEDWARAVSRIVVRTLPARGDLVRFFAGRPEVHGQMKLLWQQKTIDLLFPGLLSSAGGDAGAPAESLPRRRPELGASEPADASEPAATDASASRYSSFVFSKMRSERAAREGCLRRGDVSPPKAAFVAAAVAVAEAASAGLVPAPRGPAAEAAGIPWLSTCVMYSGLIHSWDGKTAAAALAKHPLLSPRLWRWMCDNALLVDQYVSGTEQPANRRSEVGDVLLLFLVCYNSKLQVLDDDEFYGLERPFALCDVGAMVRIFARLGFRLAWNSESASSADPPEDGQTRASQARDASANTFISILSQQPGQSSQSSQPEPPQPTPPPPPPPCASRLSLKPLPLSGLERQRGSVTSRLASLSKDLLQKLHTRQATRPFCDPEEWLISDFKQTHGFHFADVLAYLNDKGRNSPVETLFGLLRDLTSEMLLLSDPLERVFGDLFGDRLRNFFSGLQELYSASVGTTSDDSSSGRRGSRRESLRDGEAGAAGQEAAASETLVNGRGSDERDERERSQEEEAAGTEQERGSETLIDVPGSDQRESVHEGTPRRTDQATSTGSLVNDPAPDESKGNADTTGDMSADTAASSSQLPSAQARDTQPDQARPGQHAPDPQTGAPVQSQVPFASDTSTQTSSPSAVPSQSAGAPPGAKNKRPVTVRNDEDFIRYQKVVNRMPYIVPYQQRLEYFRKLVERDRRAHHASDVKFPVTVRRMHTLEDSLSEFRRLERSNGNSHLKAQLHVRFLHSDGVPEDGVDEGGLFKEYLETVVAQAFSPESKFFVPAPAGTGLFPNPNVGEVLQSYEDRHLAPATAATSRVSLRLSSVTEPPHETPPTPPAAPADADPPLPAHPGGAPPAAPPPLPASLLELYHFCGRILAKAIYEGVVLDVTFAPFFLSSIKGHDHTLSDLESYDAGLYKNLLSLRNIDDIEALDLNFTADTPGLGTALLIPEGNTIAVAQENFELYLRSLASYRTCTQVAEQTAAFLAGLHEILPASMLSLFDRGEIQQLVSGVNGSYDILELRAHTRYDNYSESDPVIENFWATLAGFEDEQKANFLRFVMSSKRPPLLGFGHIHPPFTIRKVDCEKDTNAEKYLNRLPSAATCFNLLCLPPYPTRENLEDKLVYAISSETGFEL